MIEWILPILALGAVSGLGISLAVIRHRDHLRVWQEVAHRAGLRDVTHTLIDGFSGTAGKHRVNLYNYQRGKYEQGTRITIAGDSGLTLRPETAGPQTEELAGHREIELGDEGFDDAVWVMGSAETARALLDAETRKVIREMLGGAVRVPKGNASVKARVTVQGGDVEADVPETSGGEWPELLAGVLETLLGVARRLQRPPDPVGRIVANTAAEPEWQVRVQNLLLLAGSYPHHPATREALKRGSEDEREEVQLAAALALGGEEARPMLVEVATREWSEDSCAARAVAALGEHLPADRIREVLSHALRTGRQRTAEACLGSLGRSGGPAAVEPLAKVLAVSHGPLAVAAARALGGSGAAGAEGPLLRALEGAPDPVRAAAAQALGRVGSAHSVLLLRDIADSRDAEGGLRRAARQAVAEIQSRLHGASPGQVSLVAAEGGTLSLAEEEPAGQVSLAKPREEA